MGRSYRAAQAHCDAACLRTWQSDARTGRWQAHRNRVGETYSKDRHYVILHHANLIKGHENPFKEKKEGIAETATKESPDAAKPLTLDWTAAALVQPMAEQAGWNLKTTSAATKPDGRVPHAIQLPLRQNFFEGCTGAISNQSGEKVLVGYCWDFARPQSQPQPQTRLTLCDLQGGRVLFTITGACKATPLALSDDAGQVLMKVEEEHKSHTELWRLDPKGITKLWRLGEERETNVKWAAFLAEDRFIALFDTGRLGVLKASSAGPIFFLSIDFFCLPALSPDRRYVAFSQGAKMGVVDVTAGRTAAVQDTSELRYPHFCFSPDGLRLACADENSLRVWNLSDGSIDREFPPGAFRFLNQNIVWPNSRYVLFSMQHLIDLDSHVLVWSYKGAETAVWANGMCAFVVGDRGNQKAAALVTARVPPASLTATIDNEMKDPDFYVLKPGVTVKLDLTGLGNAVEQAKAAASLTKKLEANGMKVGPEGSIALVGVTAKGEERRLDIRGFGANPWHRYPVQEYLATLKFVHQGKTVWETSSSSIPGIIQLGADDTVEGVLRKSEKPTYRLFEQVQLPRLLTKASAVGGLGVTNVTLNGAE